MKTLYLMRHAKAENSEGSSADIDRQLVKRGKADAEKVGRTPTKG